MLCIKKHLALDALKLMQSLVSGFQQKKVMPSSFLQAKVPVENLQSELAHRSQALVSEETVAGGHKKTHL